MHDHSDSLALNPADEQPDIPSRALADFSRRLYTLYSRAEHGDFGGTDIPAAPAHPYLQQLFQAHVEAVRARDREQTRLSSPSEQFSPLRKRGLTRRECDVLYFVSRGLTDAQIAAELGCSSKTVGKHIEHLLAKTSTETRLAAVGTALLWLEQRADGPIKTESLPP